MGTIQYTAKRSLAPGHVAESAYVLDFEIADFSSEDAAVRDEERSTGGGSEVTFQRLDRFYTVKLAPVRGHDLYLMREFLDSTESGEAFRVWLFGDEAAPVILKRLEDGHQEAAFMRAGGPDLDWFEAEFTGVESEDSEAINIYAPQVGGSTGGLNAVYVGGTVTFEAAASPINSSIVGLSTEVFALDVPKEAVFGTLLSGDLAHLVTIGIMRDRLNFAFPLVVVIRAPERSAPETAFFDDVTITDAGVPLADMPLTVGIAPSGGFYYFSDTDLGGGTHQYTWQWMWGSPSSGPLLTAGTTYVATFSA